MNPVRAGDAAARSRTSDPPRDASASGPGPRSTGAAGLGTARTGSLRRRPTGSPPPLPRKLGTSGKVWLGVAGLLAVALVAFVLRGQPLVAARLETWFLRSIASLRADWLTPVMCVLRRVVEGVAGEALERAAGGTGVSVVRPSEAAARAGAATVRRTPR